MVVKRAFQTKKAEVATGLFTKMLMIIVSGQKFTRQKAVKTIFLIIISNPAIHYFVSKACLDEDHLLFLYLMHNTATVDSQLDKRSEIDSLGELSIWK